MRYGIAAALVLLFAAGPLPAAAPDRSAQWLAQADGDFASGLAGRAVADYRGFLREYPDDPRADYATYMVGESCRLARAQMIVPPCYFTEFSPDGGAQQYRGLAHYLAEAYGMYADVSEGDSYWYYDMRAYRELLKRYPKSEYADDSEFLLVEPEQQRRAWAIGMGPDVAETARGLIGAYEAILRKHPDTNRRADIAAAIRELREIERRNAPALPETRQQPGARHRNEWGLTAGMPPREGAPLGMVPPLACEAVFAWVGGGGQRGVTWCMNGNQRACASSSDSAPASTANSPKR